MKLEKFTIIVIKDKKSKRYTGFLKEFPTVITEGEDKEEVRKNLAGAMYDIIMYADDYKEYEY